MRLMGSRNFDLNRVLDLRSLPCTTHPTGVSLALVGRSPKYRPLRPHRPRPQRRPRRQWLACRISTTVHGPKRVNKGSECEPGYEGRE